MQKPQQIRDRVRYTDDDHPLNNWKLIQRRSSRVWRDKGGMQEEYKRSDAMFYVCAWASMLTLGLLILWLTAKGLGY
jgi:hypothetical protein